jgi:peptidyl-prolyl cis-trans isomerase B (cyclophilin B)
MKDEPPTNLKPAPQYGNDVVGYTRGTLAMAKTSAPNSGGSQFFLVYADSYLPPDYTVFGSISSEGLNILDKVAAAGLPAGADPGQGAAPNLPVTIQSTAVS